MSLKDRLLASNAPAWIYEEKGDMLLGLVVNRSTRTTDYGPYEIITFLPDEPPTVGGSTTFTVRVDEEDVPYTGGPLAWHAMGAVAAKEVAQKDPQPGDRGGVLYDGQKVAQSGQGKGKKYDVIQLVVEKAVGAPVVPVAAAPAAPAESFTADDIDDDEEF